MREFPALALVGPRQCGKTTLAKSLSRVYFDLEQPEERVRLDLEWDTLVQSKRLIVLDEAQAWMDSVGITLVRDRVFGGRVEREHGIAIYEANVNAVKATIPASRLLVHNLGDGWEPLCAHLGVPVPAEPYPSRNNATDFQNKILTK